jgi:hypothetical protein
LDSSNDNAESSFAAEQKLNQLREFHDRSLEAFKEGDEDDYDSEEEGDRLRSSIRKTKLFDAAKN